MEIEVEIIDKMITMVLIDDGSSVNIIPAFIMEKLELKVTHPSFLYNTKINGSKFGANFRPN